MSGIILDMLAGMILLVLSAASVVAILEVRRPTGCTLAAFFERVRESKAFRKRFSRDARREERVVFIQSAKVCQVLPGSTLLEVADENGVQIPSVCRTGFCGKCCTRILSGVVQMNVEDGLTTEQKNAGYVLPCVSRVTGSVVVQA
jgi:ferredoxin